MTRLTAAREINLDRPVTFTFDGKTYQGYEGDTLASALVANGVDVLSRSFKRHWVLCRKARMVCNSARHVTVGI